MIHFLQKIRHFKMPGYARNDEVSYSRSHAPAWERIVRCVCTKQKHLHEKILERAPRPILESFYRGSTPTKETGLAIKTIANNRNRLGLEYLKKITKTVSAVVLLSTSSFVCAEEWLSLGENPAGKTASPPYQLEDYPLGNNTERHYPPNQVFNLWVQDETLFKPVEADRIEIKKVLEKEVETFKLDNAVPAIGFKSGTVDIPDSYVEKLRAVLSEMKNRKIGRAHV